MKNIDNLELNVMSCLLIKPELMNEVILEDKHFIKHQRLWKFMKAFYKKFVTFDVQLMYSICKDKFHIVHYMDWLLDLEPTANNFELYQKRLIEEYEESEIENQKINFIYDYANDLWVRKITLKEFKKKVDELLGGNENGN